jgi:hypothetical protein
MSDQKSWCFWSTHESIANEVPSATAILETIIAVPICWWIALNFGVLWPLLVSAAVAPMVLLRSDQSVATGLNWFLGIEHSIAIPAALAKVRILRNLTIGLFLLVFLIFISIFIRISATLVHFRPGIEALPHNFRRVVLCTSPTQVPEIVPGLETSNSVFKFSYALSGGRPPLELLGRNLLVFGYMWLLYLFSTPIILLTVYLPVWLYRITIKSTAWFWWPLAFLGGDLKRAQNPALFHWKVMGSLWAKTSIGLAGLSLLAFAGASFHSLVLGNNELLVPVERLLLIDWKSLWSWQLCALLGSVLSLAIVFLVNDVNGEYRIAQNTNDAKLLRTAQSKFGRIERLSRFRFLVLLAFWGLVGTHAVLYVNSTQCWFSLPPSMQEWAQDIYGDRIPRSNECLLLP